MPLSNFLPVPPSGTNPSEAKQLLNFFFFGQVFQHKLNSPFPVIARTLQDISLVMANFGFLIEGLKVEALVLINPNHRDVVVQCYT